VKLPLAVASLLLAPVSLLTAGCSSAPGDDAARSSEALVSATTSYLLPVDDGVREACRGTWGQAYCDASGAQAAADACVSSYLAAGNHPSCANAADGCFQVLTQDTPCGGDAPIYAGPTTSSCQAPVERTCAFYSQCLETAFPCGESGYAIGYGEKYCSRYDVEAGFSAAGVVWRNAVLHCLQEKLVPLLSETSTLTCDGVTTFAFDSHPGCYTAGPSICFLPPGDVYNVVKTIDGQDILSLRSAKQMAAVAGTCILQLGGAIFHFDQVGGFEPQSKEHANIPASMRDRGALADQLLFWQDVQAHGVDGVSRQ
jgi:hypothetical protein